MAYSCCVNGCDTKFRINGTSEGIKQHKIPKNPHMKALWMKILKLNDDEVKTHTAVCDLHFKHLPVIRKSLIVKQDQIID